MVVGKSVNEVGRRSVQEGDVHLDQFGVRGEKALKLVLDGVHGVERAVCADR